MQKPRKTSRGEFLRGGEGEGPLLVVSAGRPTRHIIGAEYSPSYEHELVTTFKTQPLLDLIGHLSAIKIMSSLCVCVCAVTSPLRQ